MRGDTVLEGLDEARAAARRARRGAGVDYDDVVATLEAEGVQKFADSFDEIVDEHRRQARRAGGRMTPTPAEIVERIWARDPTVWTGAGRGALARLARRAVADAARTSTCCSQFADVGRRPGRRGRAARDGRLVARARGAAADVSAARRSTSSTRRIRRRSATLEAKLDLAAHALHLGVEVGLDARDALAHRLLLGADAPNGELWAAITDPGSALEELARERGFARRLPGRADDRRPLLGAVAVRDACRRR